RAAGDHRGARIAGPRAELLHRPGTRGTARLHDGTMQIARPAAILLARLEHIAAEAPDCLRRGDAEQPLGLGVEVADDAVLVDRVHALDDAAEHRARLSLAPAQGAREL